VGGQVSEVEQLRAENAALRAECASPHAVIAELRAEIAALRAENAELRARLGQNSSNSSKPPSTDSPFKRAPPSLPTGRKAGAQRGHKGHVRPRLDPTRSESIVPCTCAHCGTALPPEAIELEPQRHQVIDIVVQPLVVDYLLFVGRCPKCRRRTRAKVPAGVPQGAFGPRVEASIALLTLHGVSRQDAAELMRVLFGVRISVGSVQRSCERIDDSIAAAVQRIADHIERAAVAHADETGWYVRGKLGWMWMALCNEAELFRFNPRRNTDAMISLLGSFDGLLHSDRWKPYAFFSPEMRQLCHAHLRRDIQAIIDRGGKDATLGERLLALSDRMFHVWHRFERGEINSDGLCTEMAPIQAEWKREVEAAATDGAASKTRALCGSMVELWPALWNFVECEGVVPTNNEGERAVRRPVKVRKNSFGSTSDRGAKMIADLLTVMGTARRQGVELLDWFVRTRVAALLGVPGPPLLQAP